MSTLIFSYGSNLEPRQLLERCPRARFIGTATLPHHRLAFVDVNRRGVATIEPFKRASVHGAVHEIGPIDLMSLDRCEGHPNHYRRESVWVDMRERGFVEVETYAVPLALELGAHPLRRLPQRDYVERVMLGYHKFGFPFAEVRGALKRAGVRERRSLSD